MGTLFTERIICVLPAALKDEANAIIAAHFDAEGGEDTFTVGLSADGTAPATHYWCSTATTLEHRPQLEAYVAGRAAAGAKCWDGNNVSPQEVLAQVGLQPVTSV